ncbi:yolk ferritin-like [Physella acuta]|uniref:yolk ferritin-like n=1 Tax=Physella acuta TaxID=109671 RepID=UPI0027DCB31F|nr:yolk ferritin-like [Physella acuta]
MKAIGILFFVLMFVSSSHQIEEDFVTMVSQNFNPKMNSKLEQHILHLHKQELALKAYESYYGRSDVDLPGLKKVMKELKERAHENALEITTFINARGGIIRYPAVQLSAACDDIGRSLTAYHVTQPSTTTSVSLAPRTTPYICQFLTKPEKSEPTKKKKVSGIKKFLGFLDSNEDQEKRGVIQRQDWQSGLYGLEDALAFEKSINDGLLALTKAAVQFTDPLTREHMEVMLEKQADVIKRLGDLITRLRQYKQDEDYTLGEYLLDQELQS